MNFSNYWRMFFGGRSRGDLDRSREEAVAFSNSLKKGKRKSKTKKPGKKRRKPASPTTMPVKRPRKPIPDFIGYPVDSHIDFSHPPSQLNSSKTLVQSKAKNNKKVPMTKTGGKIKTVLSKRRMMKKRKQVKS